MIPVARLMARNTFCQFASTSATAILVSSMKLLYFEFHQKDNLILPLNFPIVRQVKQKDRVILTSSHTQLVFRQFAKSVYEVGGIELMVELMLKMHVEWQLLMDPMSKDENNLVGEATFCFWMKRDL